MSYSINIMSEKRQSISRQEKQKYAKLIQGGANFKAIGSLYKKKHGQELARANFHRWKKESVDILASSSKRKFHQQRSKSQVMKDYEAKLVSEYQKRKLKIKPRQVAGFLQEIRDDYFPESEELRKIQFSRNFVRKIIRDLGRRSSKKMDKIRLASDDFRKKVS